MMSGWRVVDAMNSSGRVKVHFTGRPVFLARSATTGSVVISFLPPKLPPTMVATMRIRHRRDRLVLDGDFFERLGGNLLGNGSDRGHAVARVKHALVGQHRLILQ